MRLTSVKDKAHNKRLLQLPFCILALSVNAEARHCLPVHKITPDHTHIKSGYKPDSFCILTRSVYAEGAYETASESHTRRHATVNHKMVIQSPDNAECGLPAICVRPRPTCWRLLIAPLHTRQQSTKVSEVGILGIHGSLLKKIKGGPRLCYCCRSF